MIEFTHTITDREGLHARPASELTSASRAWESDVLVSRNGGAPVDAKNPVRLMGLCACQGDSLHVTVQGADEEWAARDIRRVVDAL